MHDLRAKESKAAALAVPIVAFTMAAWCLALLVISFPSVDLHRFSNWAVFMGSFAILLRLGIKSWSGILAACLAVTFNPFKPIPFFNTEVAVNILSAVAFGVIGWLALRDLKLPPKPPAPV